MAEDTRPDEEALRQRLAEIGESEDPAGEVRRLAEELDDGESRSEKIARLEGEIEKRRGRLRELRVEDAQSDGLTVEDFEAMSSSARRQLKEDDPELYSSLQEQKRKQGEDALFSGRAPRFGSGL